MRVTLRVSTAITAAVVGLSCASAGKSAIAPQAGMAAEAAPPEPPPGAGMPATEAALVTMADRHAPAEAAPADAAALNAQKRGQFAVVREFPVPNYDPADAGPRRDFRETIFWSPAVKTGADGRAIVQFPTSDAVTSFKVVAEGVTASGLPGHGETAIASRLPLSLAANLPVEVTTGDRIALPVTITNTTAQGFDATVHAKSGASIDVAGGAKRSVRVAARSARTVTLQLDVKGAADSGRDAAGAAARTMSGGAGLPPGAAGAGDIELDVRAGGHRDALRRSLKIVPAGFPMQKSFAGSVGEPVRHTLALPPGVMPGSVHTTIRMYPSPVATMTQAIESIVREPSGCFEQASSSNYPNVMVLSYLKASGARAPEIAAQATASLDRGYQLLANYEAPKQGFEWWGKDPGHEALSAYGLLQFREMAKVYPKVDQAMVDRTATWLRSRRDGKGGFKRDKGDGHAFSQADDAVVNAYVTYALAESGEKDLAQELGRTKQVVGSTKDPYVLALSAAALLAADPESIEGKAGLARLAKLQAPDGRFPGANHTITRSGGQALDIETTALAAIAMQKSSAAYRGEIDRALTWITQQRSAYGGFSSTQATILALTALTKQAQANRIPQGAKVTVLVNGAVVATTGLDPNGGAITLPDVGSKLVAGDNTIELRATSGARVDYSVGASWYERAPVTSRAATVAVQTRLDRARVRVGRPIKLTATVTNVTASGQPMTMARVGLPGGLKFQPWQLDELVEKNLVDYVETREREVVLYFRQMKPREVRRVPIQLLAQVPGRYVGPPSSAYLYYTDEHRQYARPLAVDVTRPIAKKKPITPVVPTTP